MDDSSLLAQLALEIAKLIEMDKDDKIMDAKQCCAYFKTDPKGLEKLERDGLPYIDVGSGKRKARRYHRDAVDAFMGVKR